MFYSLKVINKKQALEKVLLLMKQVIADFYNKLNINTITRFEFRISNINIIEWFSSQPHLVKLFWSSRGNDFILAGLGHAIYFNDKLLSNNKLFNMIKCSFLQNAPELRFFSAVSFNEHSAKNGIWNTFEKTSVILPQFEIYKKRNETHACLNLVSSNNKDDLLQNLNMIKNSPKKFIKNFMIINQVKIPSKKSWCNLVNFAINNIKNTAIKKVVLARKIILYFKDNLDANLIFKLLTDMEINAFFFCFYSPLGVKYLGASPELLCRRKRQYIYTEALAGTIKRCYNSKKDQHQKEVFFQSKKNNKEQNIVVLQMEAKLKKLCVNYKIHKKQIYSQKYIHHLCTKFTGILNNDIDDYKILNSLHPSSAICGFPFYEAAYFINKYESFDRGLYSGVIGVFSRDESDFAVSIRSALVINNRIDIFIGAGIVDGSSALDEWYETNSKMQIFNKIFNKCCD